MSSYPDYVQHYENRIKNYAFLYIRREPISPEMVRSMISDLNDLLLVVKRLEEFEAQRRYDS